MSALRAMILLAALALANCGESPQTHYFTLTPVAETKPAATTITAPVTVAAVHVPPALDRREMVRRTGENTVDISGQDRWTAPLDEMVRRVLSQDLAERLPKDKVIPPDAPAPPNTAQIVVSIAQFGPEANGKATLDGSWSLLEGERDRPVLRRDVALETGSSAGDASAQAASMSQLIGQLADQIAMTLTEAKAQSRQKRGT